VGFVVMFKSTFTGVKMFYSMLVLVTAVACYGFGWYMDRQETIAWSNRCLLQSFDDLEGIKLKKWDLTLTPDAFMRFKKTYQNGRQEYYSFNLRRFKDMDYLGTTIRGTIRFRTLADDVIVQTYNDPKGNVDSMTTTLKIPVRNMDAERLDSLYSALNYLKAKRN
jgi:hypothetical protein